MHANKYYIIIKSCTNTTKPFIIYFLESLETVLWLWLKVISGKKHCVVTTANWTQPHFVNLYQECQVCVLENNIILLCVHGCKFYALYNTTAHNNIIIAEVAEKVLDKCSNYDEFNSRMNENFWVEFNFEFIEDLQDLGSVHNTMLYHALHCAELVSLENIHFQ